MNTEDIVELDLLNMGPIIKRAGGEFSPNYRRVKLQEELSLGYVLIAEYESSMLVGYVQFIPKVNGEVYFLSIQVHPSFRSGLVLKKLIKRTMQKLKSIEFSIITSSVHTANQASISFHKRLGFSEVNRVEGRVNFVIQKSKIANKWLKYTSATKGDTSAGRP